MPSEEYEDGIAYEAVIAQLQHENEELRVRLTQALKNTPLSEAVDSVIVLVKQTDPMKLYIWVAIGSMAIIALCRVIEVLFPNGVLE